MVGVLLAAAVPIATATMRGGASAPPRVWKHPGVSTLETFGVALLSGLAIFAPIAIPFVLAGIVLGLVPLGRE